MCVPSRIKNTMNCHWKRSPITPEPNPDFSRLPNTCLIFWRQLCYLSITSGSVKFPWKQSWTGVSFRMVLEQYHKQTWSGNAKTSDLGICTCFLGGLGLPQFQRWILAWGWINVKRKSAGIQIHKGLLGEPEQKGGLWKWKVGLKHLSNPEHHDIDIFEVWKVESIIN